MKRKERTESEYVPRICELCASDVVDNECDLDVIPAFEGLHQVDVWCTCIGNPKLHVSLDVRATLYFLLHLLQLLRVPSMDDNVEPLRVELFGDGLANPVGRTRNQSIGCSAVQEARISGWTKEVEVQERRKVPGGLERDGRTDRGQCLSG